jgi:hypothetical protein
MEPISLAVGIGAVVVAGTALVAGIASLFSGDEQERQIKHSAKDARRRMEKTSGDYLDEVDDLVRRKR